MTDRRFFDHATKLLDMVEPDIETLEKAFNNVTEKLEVTAVLLYHLKDTRSMNLRSSAEDFLRMIEHFLQLKTVCNNIRRKNVRFFS